MPTAQKSEATVANVGLSTDESLAAIRYKQGGRTVYQFALTPTELTAVVSRPDPVIPRSNNREIRTAHAKSFAEYFQGNENWVIPGIILRSPNIFTGN